MVSWKASLVALKLHLNHLLEAKTLNLLLGRLPMSQLFNLRPLQLQVLSLWGLLSHLLNQRQTTTCHTFNPYWKYQDHTYKWSSCIFTWPYNHETYTRTLQVVWRWSRVLNTFSETIWYSYDFLTRKFPHGLNLSPACSTWLVHLGIYDWDDLTLISTRYTVESLSEYIVKNQLGNE